MSRRRILLAFLVSPIAAPIVAFLMALLAPTLLVPSHRGLTPKAFAVLPVYLAYALPIAYVSTFLIGGPLWLVFKHYRIRRPAAFIVAGAFIGWIASAATVVMPGNIGTISFTDFLNPIANPYVGIDIVAASISAALFWRIAFSGQPSR
jgi:hypothetical protein